MKQVLFVIVILLLCVSLNPAQEIELEAQTILLPCNFKLVSVNYSGRKPMALVREMRSGEKAETWFFQPLDSVDRLGIGDKALVIRECENVYRK